MGRQKRVAIVGLPRFAKKLTDRLIAYGVNAKIRCFDTYYNNWEKLAAIPYIISCDVVYSINGSLLNSNVFNLALWAKKRLIMHWVGTDVLKAEMAIQSGTYRSDYIERAEHLCEVEWIREELKALGIKAEIQNFVAFEKDMKPATRPENFNVLSYLHPDREEFYGIKELITCAETFPEIPFYLVGTSAYDQTTPANMKFLGWINNLDEMIEKAGICVRIPQHDGLSSFVLESLAKAKFVAYKYHFPFCDPCSNAQELIKIVEEKRQLFESGSPFENSGSSEYISKEFDKDKIYGSLLSRLGVS
ncbi:MAG: hypothetical protein RIC15_01125 [Vicingaceae bacterium]